MADLVGKVVIVTGASSGIGEATAVYFASKGSNVTLNGRDTGRLQDAVTRCETAARDNGHTGSRFLAVAGDVTDASVRNDIIEQTTKTFGQIDVLVPNQAVIMEGDNFDNLTEESFDKTINTNLKASLFLIQQAVPALERTRGCIVCVSSIVSQFPTRNNIFCDSLSKAGLIFMVRSLAMELGPKGIRVNCILLTLVQTRIFRSDPTTFCELDATDAHVGAFTPLSESQRSPEEQAEVIGFLSSEASRLVSGQCVAVDGAVIQRGNPFNYMN